MDRRSKNQKLKIAIVNKFFFLKGGQESLAFSEAEMLKSAGYEVAFFSMKHPNNPESYKYDKYFVDYVEFSNAGKEYGFLDKFKIAKNFIRNNEAAKKFELFLNDFQPDIIHCHGISHQLTPSILPVAKKYNIPVVQTLHDYQLVCPSYSLLVSGKKICNDFKCRQGNYIHCALNKCVKNSYSASLLSAIEMYCNAQLFRKYVKKFICPSKFLQKVMTDGKIKKDQTVYIPNSINVKEYNPRYESKGYFIYVGRLSFEKGLLTLLKAFKQLPQANLKIIGTGPEENKLKQFKENNNLNNVEFLGFKNKLELTNYFNKCEAMILTSECFENAPISIIESFSSGKPVIASHLGGSPEMVKQGFNGYTFEYGNVDSLTNCIKNFLNNKNLHQVLGKNARQFALDNYDNEKHFKEVVSLYDNLKK